LVDLEGEDFDSFMGESDQTMPCKFLSNCSFDGHLNMRQLLMAEFMKKNNKLKL